MASNVALTDTFEQWRVKTNQLLTLTQTIGSDDVIRIANSVNSTSNTTGALIVTGGAGIGKSVTIGENLQVHGNIIANGNITALGSLNLGDENTDNITFNADINSHIIPDADDTYALGNSSNRFADVYVTGFVGSNSSASLIIPSGNTSQRSGIAGSIRWNSELSRFEGNTGTIFQPLGLATDTDGDTKITVETGTNDEDVVRIFTGNSTTLSTEVVTVAGANVAIGTSGVNATAMLEVNGTVNIAGNTTLLGTTTTIDGTTLSIGSNTSANGTAIFTGTTFDVKPGNSTVNTQVSATSTTLTIASSNTSVNTTLLTNSSTFTIAQGNTTVNTHFDIDITGVTVAVGNSTVNTALTTNSVAFVVATKDFQATANTTINGANTNILGAKATVGSSTLNITSNDINSTSNAIFNATNFNVASNTVISGALTSSGATTISGILLATGSTSNIHSTNTTIDGTNLNVTSNSVFSGNVSFDSANVSVSTGYFYVGGGGRFSGTVTIDQDLVVQGTTTTVSSSSLELSDNTLYLNGGNTQWEMTASANNTYAGNVQFAGHYKGAANTDFRVRITNTGGGSGGVDQFEFSNNGGSTYGSPQDITTANTALTLEAGVTITFEDNTGLTNGDFWTASMVTNHNDLGWSGNYNDGAYKHAGIFRDATDGFFKFFDNYQREPDEEVNLDTANNTFNYAPVALGSLLITNTASAGNNASNGNLVVIGSTSLGDVSINTGNSTVNSAMTINTTAITLDTTSFSIVANTTITGSVGITGSANVTGTFLVGNATSLQSCNVAGDLGFDSKTFTYTTPIIVRDSSGSVISSGYILNV